MFRKWAYPCGLLFVFGFLMLSGTSAYAQETFTSSDNKLTFEYPKRWKAEEVDGAIRLTAPDASLYTLRRDTITNPPTTAPIADSTLKLEAAKIIAPILKNAVLVSASSVQMDYGAGVVYRFREKGAKDPVVLTSMYMGFIGRRSLVLTPEKPAQSSQAIGISTIFQSVNFSDNRRPEFRPPPIPRPQESQIKPFVGTVSYTKQLVPILKEKCEACHRARAPLARYSVTTYADFIKGGVVAKAVTPGKPNESPLLEHLTGKRSIMPKNSRPLTPEQIGMFQKWISDGAKDDTNASSETAKPDPETKPKTKNEQANSDTSPRAEEGMSVAQIRQRLQNLRGNNNREQRQRLMQMLRQRRQQTQGVPSEPTKPRQTFNGHLLPTDKSFSLVLLPDQSAKAEWAESSTRSAQYKGTYTAEGEGFVVTLNRVEPGEPRMAKSLAIVLKPDSGKMQAWFGIDGQPARRVASNIQTVK